MPTEAKKAAVAALKEDLSGAKATIVADYRGLTVSEISAVRRVLRGEGIKYRVVKNRLAKIAAQEAGNTELVGLLQGPSALAIGGDEVALARSFLDAIRPFKTVTVRGAVLSGKMVDANSVTRLATLPSREVLLSQLAGGMMAPLTSMASLLAAPLRNFGYALTQLVGMKDAQAPKAEAPKAEAPKAEAPKAEVPAAEASVAEAVAAPAETEAPAEESTADSAVESTETEASGSTDTSDEPAADSEPAAESTDSESTDSESKTERES